MKANPLAPLLTTPEPPELGPGPRSNVPTLPLLREQMDRALRQAELPDVPAELVRALVLLWHDQLDAAHALSQTIENADGSYVHALVHRREPDYGNAKYWFRRVGRHSCFDELAARASALLKSGAEPGRGLETKLIPHGRWDPFGFVDACEATAGLAAGDLQAAVLREIQQVEFKLLLDHFATMPRVLRKGSRL